MVFEARWRHLIEQQQAGAVVAHSPHHADLQAWLADLIPDRLWRSAAIKADLDHLSKVLDINLDAANSPSTLTKDLTDHILDITTAKPHTLIAYSWIMYMAIFSGGRWVREQLAQAGPSFWQTPETQEGRFGGSAHPVPGFSLFYFEGERDGEDVKAEYKARLEYAEKLLTTRERDEVVREAHVIFERCIQLVVELDERLASGSSLPEREHGSASGKLRSVSRQSELVSGVRGSGRGSLMALLAVALACLTAWMLVK